MARKFNKTAYKKWLDCLAKVIVKTRDGFTCQIVHDPACSGTMQPLDRNCQWCHIKSRQANATRWSILNAITGCGHCHAWAHANPNEFGVWFVAKYPHRDKAINYIAIVEKKGTWKQADFELIERRLLEKAIELNVDYLHVNTKYRDRFKKRTEEMRMEL